jgi:hypothetical protein
MYLALRVLVLLVLLSCNRPQSSMPAITENTKRIYVSEQEALFFYNVRSLSYQRIDDVETCIRTFVFKEKNSNFNIGIKHAWNRNEAYLFFMNEAGEALQEELAIEWVDQRNKMSGSLQYLPGHPIKDFLFIRKLMQYATSGIELSCNGNKILTEKEFRVFRIVYEDYVKMISEK